MSTTKQLEPVYNSTSTAALIFKTYVQLPVSDEETAVSDSKACVIGEIEFTGTHYVTFVKGKKVHWICGNLAGKEKFGSKILYLC